MLKMRIVNESSNVMSKIKEWFPMFNLLTLFQSLEADKAVFKNHNLVLHCPDDILEKYLRSCYIEMQVINHFFEI